MPPFCGFPNSGEAHLLLFMTSYRNGSEDEPNSYGVSSNNHEVSCPASKLWRRQPASWCKELPWRHQDQHSCKCH